MRRVENYPFETAVNWFKGRISDGSEAEKIIWDGRGEYIKGFAVAWKILKDPTGTWSEKWAIRFMLMERKDLRKMNNKMFNPDRIYANRWVNTGLGKLHDLNRLWEICGVL